MAIPPEFLKGAGRPSTPPLALVTGGARRIGAALATALAEEGFRVALHCNRSRAEAEALAARLSEAGAPAPIVVAADLASPTVGADILDALPEPPVLLVNNASLFEEDQLNSFAPALWDRHMAVNARAPALLTQAFATRLPAGSRGLVVNLSDAKLASPNPDFFSYTLSKYALSGLTELAARALAPRIRVNAIAPSITLVSGPQSRENFGKAHAFNPLGEGVDVAHLVAALRFLLHTPTVTGQTITVDAGLRFLALPRDIAHVVAGGETQ
jgi:NAD(P)-dependent dehydrogenase (short-subunit alcohol dehydrogenase family)